MNYDKQKPLTQEEIDYINSKDGLCVMNSPRYPKGYIHVEIAWSLPVEVYRNYDEFFFGVPRIANKENYWVVSPSYERGRREYSFNFETKQFKNIDDALKYGFNEYKNG